MTPARGRDMIDFVRGAFGVSVRKACRAIPACRSTYHYRSRRPEQAPLRKSLNLVGVSSVYLTVYGTALWPEVVLDCPRIMACIG